MEREIGILARKRIEKEIKDFNKEPPENISIDFIDDSDISRIEASIKGPEESPYEGYVFKVYIEYPPDYPFKPPKFEFITKIYHPNIKIYGRNFFCCCVLPEIVTAWSPNLTFQDILSKGIELLSTPDVYHLCDNSDREIAELYKSNNEEFNRRAKEWAQRYAEPE